MEINLLSLESLYSIAFHNVKNQLQPLAEHEKAQPKLVESLITSILKTALFTPSLEVQVLEPMANALFGLMVWNHNTFLHVLEQFIQSEAAHDVQVQQRLKQTFANMTKNVQPNVTDRVNLNTFVRNFETCLFTVRAMLKRK